MVYVEAELWGSSLAERMAEMTVKTKDEMRAFCMAASMVTH
jgi:hypothetical protein